MFPENKKIQSSPTDGTHPSEAARASNREPFSVSELRATVQGQVFAPQDDGYDQARSTLYGNPDHRPAVVVRPVNADNVARVVTLARETGLELAVRCGGHSGAGHSTTNGGIVLDLRDMHAIDIDVENRTAWAEAGLTAGEVTAALAEHGLAVGFGDTGSVGIGGITLGGGVGYLVRKHGLTIDNLLAAEVVTAGGQVLYTDAESHPDLFWAIRGGGGNFGVVTRFQFRLHPLEQILGGMLFLPATPETVAGFIAAAESAPEELSTIANIMPAPPMPFIPAELHGKLVIMGMLVYAGPVEAGQRAVAPFRALAEPLADLLRPMRYPEMFPPEEGGDYHPTAVARTLFLDRVDLDAARTIVDTLQAADAQMRVAQIRVLGGAAARVPDEATAYPHRRARIMAALAAFYNSPEEKGARQAWIMDFAAALDQGYSGAYVNFLADEGPSRVRDAYPGKTWERLAAIKARYDPHNLFHRNQNITPAVVG